MWADHAKAGLCTPVGLGKGGDGCAELRDEQRKGDGQKGLLGARRKGGGCTYEWCE